MMPEMLETSIGHLPAGALCMAGVKVGHGNTAQRILYVIWRTYAGGGKMPPATCASQLKPWIRWLRLSAVMPMPSIRRFMVRPICNFCPMPT